MRPVEHEIDEVAKRTRRDVASRPDQVTLLLGIDQHLF